MISVLFFTLSNGPVVILYRHSKHWHEFNSLRLGIPLQSDQSLFLVDYQPPMPLSRKGRAAVSILLGSEDQGALAELLDSMVSEASDVPPGAQETSGTPVARASATDNSSATPGVCVVTYRSYEQSGGQKSALPPPRAHIMSAQSAQCCAMPHPLVHQAHCLVQPAHDKLIKCTERLPESGKNYAAWARFSYAVLRVRHLAAIVDGTADKLDPEYASAEARAYFQLADNVDTKLLGQIQTTDAFEFWHTLKARFSNRSELARCTAQALLRSKWIRPGESMQDHMRSLRDLKVQFENAGGELDEESWQEIIAFSIVRSSRDVLHR